MRTDKTILNNKPDILICDNEKGTCILRHFRLRTCRLIDAGISEDRYVIKKEAEKIPCYKTLIQYYIMNVSTITLLFKVISGYMFRLDLVILRPILTFVLPDTVQ